MVLDGAGMMLSEDGGETPIAPDRFCYRPPHTAHDVRNTGTTLLRYVYVVTKTT